jgi:hypothetical protein
MIQASYAIVPDFFNGLLVLTNGSTGPYRRCPERAFGRLDEVSQTFVQACPPSGVIIFRPIEALKYATKLLAKGRTVALSCGDFIA